MNRPRLFVALAAVAVALVNAAPAPGQVERKDKKPLRWGADLTGGAPYVYKDDKDKLIGFEVELAEYLVKEIERESKMVQGDWQTLPELLDRGDIDIVLNGYGFREDLEKKYPATVPYYVYKLALIIHKDSADAIGSWNDLRHEKAMGVKRTVGVLNGSVAHEHMEGKMFGNRINLQRGDDVSNLATMVEEKKLDAIVQDTPTALYNVKKGKNLKLVEEPRKAGFYVILTRAGDKNLRDQLNAAIRKGIKDGTFKTIYGKYGLWNEDQERLLYWAEQIEKPPFPRDE